MTTTSAASYAVFTPPEGGHYVVIEALFAPFAFFAAFVVNGG